MFRLSWVVIIAALTAGLVLAEIQPIDVEPVVKKEQPPDFEHSVLDRASTINKSTSQDDTGNGALPLGGSGGDLPPNSSESAKQEGDLNFMHAFVAALSMIIVTELGDKTFFIAAIMAMNHPRLTVFAGAMTALTIMHVLSAMFGYVITWIPRVYTFYASSALFAIFGIKMLREGWNMKPDEGQEEFEEVQSDLRRREDDLQKEPLEEGGAGLRGRGIRRNRILALVSRIFLQALTLTFLAEWGDRSQIATVVMAAREDVYGVIIGGLLGHFLCTGLGVLGGRMIATKISIRTVTLIGGVTFLIFAVSAVIMGP